MAKLLLLNGPNLNLLGTREPGIYGATTLADIERRCMSLAQTLGPHQLACFQSNAEHALVDRIHAARQDGTEFIVINPAAFTHTSVALHDAIKGAGVTVIELHISNVHAREAFRHHSFIAPAARAVMAGFGVQGYPLAIDGLVAVTTG